MRRCLACIMTGAVLWKARIVCKLSFLLILLLSVLCCLHAVAAPGLLLRAFFAHTAGFGACIVGMRGLVCCAGTMPCCFLGFSHARHACVDSLLPLVGAWCSGA